MRVLLSRRQRDERGAVAIMMATAMLMICVLGALVVDFGMAYVNKNQAQAAADAGALAAGKVYVAAKATCSTTVGVGVVLAPAGTEDSALHEAEVIRTANMPNSKPGTLAATCEDGAVKVAYDVQADSPLTLGAIAVGSDHMTVERHAAAKLGVSEKAVGSLRPWMICGAQVPPGPPFAPLVTEIGLPTNGHTPPTDGCAVNKPGEWWKTLCVGDKGSNPETEQAVLYGCEKVEIAPSTPGSLNPAMELLQDCNPTYPDKNGWIETEYCLTDDTGRDVKNLDDEWATLLGKTIAMPVFCDKAPVPGTPQCDPSSIPDGTKPTWPIWRIAAVTVCGYAMKGKWSPATLPAGDCNNMNTSGLSPLDFTKDEIGFLVIFKGLIKPGDATGFPVEVATTMRLIE